MSDNKKSAADSVTHPNPESNKTSRRKLLQAGAAALATGAAASSGEAKADFAPLRSLPIIRSRIGSKNNVLKQRAINDYHANMREFGGSLSQHGTQLLHQKPRAGSSCDFDVLIIGSGYGASICAARLSIAKRPGTRIAVIERGKEWVPGTYGDTFLGGTGEARFQLFGRNKNTIENPVGLMNMMRNDEVNVLSGNGLGGSSLINANVAIRPDKETFEQTQWPTALRDRSVLDPYYDLAALELGVQKELPDSSSKSRAQRLAAARLATCGADFETASLTITRTPNNHGGQILNRHGLRQRGCTDCGDCCGGCNVGAKNTLAKNYLPVAKRNGAEIYTHTEVMRVEKCEDGTYRVHFKNYTQLKKGYHTTCGSVTSRIVILGAGSVGSNEILLRSKGFGMELSDRVGHQWTMNGDALGFVRKSKFKTHAAGHGTMRRGRSPASGPTIQTNITYPHRPNLHDRVLIQDGSITRGYANFLGTLMRDMDFDQTMIMLGMGHDGAGGKVGLREDGFAKISWPGIKDSQYRKKIRGEFARIAAAHGGKYKYLKIFGDNFITVHPLGGCAMADDPRYGVVNDRGQVFDGRKGGLSGSSGQALTHEGLYVSDGSVIPTAIAVNPLLTISALAERTADHIAVDQRYADLFGEKQS